MEKYQCGSTRCSLRERCMRILHVWECTFFSAKLFPARCRSVRQVIVGCTCRVARSQQQLRRPAPAGLSGSITTPSASWGSKGGITRPVRLHASHGEGVRAFHRRQQVLTRLNAVEQWTRAGGGGGRGRRCTCEERLRSSLRRSQLGRTWRHRSLPRRRPAVLVRPPGPRHGALYIPAASDLTRHGRCFRPHPRGLALVPTASTMTSTLDPSTIGKPAKAGKSSQRRHVRTLTGKRVRSAHVLDAHEPCRDP